MTRFQRKFCNFDTVRFEYDEYDETLSFIFMEEERSRIGFVDIIDIKYNLASIRDILKSYSAKARLKNQAKEAIKQIQELFELSVILLGYNPSYYYRRFMEFRDSLEG